MCTHYLKRILKFNDLWYNKPKDIWDELTKRKKLLTSQQKTVEGKLITKLLNATIAPR